MSNVRPAPKALNSLFALSPVLLGIAGTDGYFRFVNPAFHKALGHGEAILLSQPFIEFVHPDDRPATLSQLHRLTNGIPAVNFENRYRHADGSYRWLLWNTIAVTEEGLQYATALDITARKRAAEMYRELLQAVPDAILITDHRGKILKINQAAETLFGYPQVELVGQLIEVLLPVRSRNKHREQVNAFTKDPRARLMGGGLELFGLRKDGSEFPAEISLGPVEQEQGRIAICAVRDISLSKQRELALQKQKRQLVEQQRKLQSVTAKLLLAEESERRRIAIGLHDDVGQTLAAAKISLDDLLEGDLPGDAEASIREAQRLVDHAIRSTRTLTFELASAALYEIGLSAALQSACEHAGQQSGIRFRPPSGLQGNPIPEEIRVVLYRAGRELIHNIVKHSKAHTAGVSLSVSRNQIHLTVKDDGCGFETAKGFQSPDAESGIGLFSIAQQLAPIDGRLEIQSSPGAGTRAVISVLLGPKGGGR